MADQTDPTEPMDPVACSNCGRPLGVSGDDQPDWAGGPLCGDCYQARQMDDEIWRSDADDSADEG